MTFGCQRTVFTEQSGPGQHREKTQPDKRGRFESTGGKLRVARCDRLVKAWRSASGGSTTTTSRALASSWQGSSN